VVYQPTGQLIRHQRTAGLKPKDLVGIPWMLAFALSADGWWLRQDIIWSKPNPMPESVTDRCTKAHEYLFLLTKSATYYCDMEAIKEDCSENTNPRRAGNIQTLMAGTHPAMVHGTIHKEGREDGLRLHHRRDKGISAGPEWRSRTRPARRR
jgi:hypothetical protein